jgi:acetyl esterase/lipase
MLSHTQGWCDAEVSSEFDLQANVPYITRGDQTLRMNLYVPRGEGPYPGVLLVHGGAWRMGKRWHMHSVANQLAAQGYSVASISYRLAPKHRFPAQLEDCADAVRFLRKNAEEYKLDPERIGGFGYSAGGHLVSLLGTCTDTEAFPFLRQSKDKPSARLQAVVGGGAPCNFTQMGKNQRHLVYWLGDTRKNIPDVYKKASPEEHVSADDPPMFFYHGEGDRIVPVESPQSMCRTLRGAGIEAEIYTMAGVGHLAAARDETSIRKAIDFLDQKLKEKNSLQSGKQIDNEYE